MKILLTLLLLMPFVLKAQIFTPSDHFPIKDGKVVYEVIIDSLILDKDALFAASKKWIADNYQSAESVIQTEDKTTGQIIGKGRSYVPYDSSDKFKVGFNLKYSIQIDVKDNKCRFRIYDIEPVNSYDISFTNDLSLSEKRYNYLLIMAKQINLYFTALPYSLKKRLSVKDDF